MLAKLALALPTGILIAAFVLTINFAGQQLDTLTPTGGKDTLQGVELIRQKRSLSANSAENQETKRNNDKDSRRRLPHAIIIGVKKGGTRALLEYLRLHPSVRSPGPEIHFFDRYFDRGLEWYRRQMPTSVEGQITIEKTPSYFVSHGVPARIAAMNPQTKLLLVVRDPVTRALSDYSQNAAKLPSMGPFESYAFTRNTQRCEVNPHWGAIRLGVYWKYLRKWLNFFPIQNILVVSGEQLIQNPASEMKLVEQFLNLEPVITSDHFYFNSTKGFPCLKKAEGTGKPKCLGKTKGRVHPKVDQNSIECLRNYYRQHSRIFANMTGRNLTWSDL